MVTAILTFLGGPLISFLSGAAFRMIWGEVSAWMNKKLEHQQEVERMKLQADIEAARAEQQMKQIELQHTLGVKEIQVAGDVKISELEAAAFLEAQKNANKPTGIRWVDAWNGAIRPSAATLSLFIWLLSLIRTAFVLSEWDRGLISAIFGYFFADRSLAKRNK